nr:ribonuclease H-like domain-containing protein [Tanacetum cinerariifolium]
IIKKLIEDMLPLEVTPQEGKSQAKSSEQVKTPRTSVQPVETSIPAATPKPTSPKSNSSGKRRNRKLALCARVLVSAIVPKIMVTRPRLAHPIVTKSKSPIRRHITCSPSPNTSNSPPRVTAAQALVVSAAQGIQGKWGTCPILSEFKELNGGYIAFGGNPNGGKIAGKGKIKTGKLDFDDVYFVKELKFNIFSVSQMCDKKNSVLFTETECLVLSPDFKL